VLRWAVTGFMALGMLLAVLFLVVGGDTSGQLGENAPWAAWGFGGPLIVALWNLRRMWGSSGTVAASPGSPP
jgi:hypothetical protein